MKLITIYALCDPATLAVRYVGKAIDLAVRLRSHKREARNPAYHTRKVWWIRSLGGQEPAVRILEVVDECHWQERERFWIAEMKRRGCDLTNFADGGQTSPVEGRGHSEESKAKMRAAAKANGARPPSRKGGRAWNRGMAGSVKPNRTSFKRGMAATNKGVRKTHCKNGHEYTPENTRLVTRRDRGSSVAQQCRICEQAAQRKFNLRRLVAAGG